MNANEDEGNDHQPVTTGRDGYFAGRNIIFNAPSTPRLLRAESKLAALVLSQADKKLSHLLATDIPEVDSANVRYDQVPNRRREPDGLRSGTLHSALTYYKSLSTKRLVIIGGPGAGKTVFLLEFQVRLLAARKEEPEQPIPVLVSASACDTTSAWEDWLAGQISTGFGIRRRKARDLVDAGRILPLIDGLDEMVPSDTRNPARAQALIQSLNKAVLNRDRAQAIVTCRPDEYQRIALDLDKARHVKLSPLTGPSAADYLDKQFRNTAEADRWQQVLDALRTEDDPGLTERVTAELSTPWRLTLALAAFRHDGDPEKLFLPKDLTGDDYSAHVSDKLLNSYVHVAASRRPREHRSYPRDKVQHWLTSLASDLGRQSPAHVAPATDLVLHEWCQPRSLASRISYAVFMLLPFLAAVVWGLMPSGDYSVTNAAEIAVFALGASGAFSSQPPAAAPVPQPDEPADRFRHGLSAGLATGLTFGLASGCVFGPSVGLMAGLISGLIIVPVAGSASRHRNELMIMPVTWLAYALVSVLTSVLAYGAGAGALAGLAGGLVYGLVAGAIAGLSSRLISFSPQARRPQTIIRANGLQGLAGGLGIGFAAGFTTGPVARLASTINTEIPGRFRGIPFAPASGLITGIAFGVAVWFAVCGRVWIRYHLSAAWNALHGRGPLRFGAFLNWAVSARLLREAGVAYQFRHRELQDWALRQDTSDSTNSPGPKSQGHFPSD